MNGLEPLPAVEVESAVIYELLMTLSVIADPDAFGTYALGADALQAVRGRGSAELLAGIEDLTAGCSKVFPHLVALIHDCPTPRSVEHVLDCLASLDPLEVALHLLGYYMRYFRRATPPEIIRAAALGDAAARRQLLATSYPDDGPWQAALRRLLSMDPPALQARLIEVLRRGYAEVLSADEARIAPVLERDADARRALLHELSPQDVIEAATGGFEYMPEPGMTRVLLVPSVIIRPWVHTMDCRDLKIFCYAVAEESVTADPDGPPERLVRLTRAVGDERRLQVLRLLGGKRATLGEIAEHFGVAKTTMHHHLAILRSAGLVRLRTSDRTYSLRREIVPDVSALLESYLKGDER